jgi:predicted flap endonuclease-1-like 5' DNA nuclease/peptidoglycan hydrolase CwlO-like protein
MPELTATLIVLLVIAAAIGAVAGWILRGNRAAREKAAVSSGWQEQIDAQRREQDRLVDQNKSLMEQVSQFQAQHTDAKNRAKELSLAVQEAFQRRDELQREIKDIRSNLETALSERDQLASDMQARGGHEDLLQQRDERIEELTAELENWQNRLPPLIERFRVRDKDAERLEAELAEAQARIGELESGPTASESTEETRIEAVRDPDKLTDGLDASNDPDEVHGEPRDVNATRAGSNASEDIQAAVEPSGDEELPASDVVEAPAPQDERDDLKLIKGVGPAIEKTLNEMGIISFQQIADMSEYDIDRVAHRLKGFHSRIYREDWIGQARTLLDKAAHA